MTRPEKGDREVGLSANIRLDVYSVSFCYPKFIPMKTSTLKYCIDSNFPEHTTSSSSSSSKRPRLDQIPAANLDADDPLTDVRACFATLSGHLAVVSID